MSPVRARDGRILAVLRAGCSITTFGDYFVVAHPDSPPYLLHRNTGERSEIVTRPPYLGPSPAPEPAHEDR